MPMTDFICRAYAFFRTRGWLLYPAVLLFVCLSVAIFILSPITTDIRTLFPDGKADTLSQYFDLLSRTNISKKVFISLHARTAASQSQLKPAADKLTAALGSQLDFLDAGAVRPLQFFNFLLNNAPNLVNASELASLESRLAPNIIRRAMEKNYQELYAPLGLLTKNLIRKDPLDFRSIFAWRLQSLQSLSNAAFRDGYLFSKNGDSLLLNAQSKADLTDADSAARLMDAFAAATKTLPTQIEADMVGGIVHTNANASAIKSDLLLLSSLGCVALVLLFFTAFRSFGSAGIIAAPLVALCAALGGVALFSREVSAIIIGFGAVLLGIAIDFAMHVYFALSRQHGDACEALKSVSQPVVFCCLTSCAAFGALFVSGMPGLRQLALFAISGLAAALLFSLFVLPHLCKNARTTYNREKPFAPPAHPKAILAVWAIVLAACLWCGTKVSLNPDLRSLEYVPDTVHTAEERFNAAWGDIRSKAVVVAEGATLQEALSRNDAVALALRNAFPQLRMASLSLLYPSLRSQEASRRLWSAFWDTGRGERTLARIRQQGEALGFSKNAFLPFEASFNEPAAPITPETLQEAGLHFLETLFRPNAHSGSPLLLTFLPDSALVRNFFTPETEQKLGARLLSNARFKQLLEQAMNADIINFISISGVLVALLIFILLRDIRRACLALLPAVTGIALVFGIKGLAGSPLNLFDITALPLVIGLGADYGIFMAGERRQTPDRATVEAVRISGITTLIGFGVLVLARHPFLFSLGLTVSLGVGAALLTALYLLPALSVPGKERA